MSMDNKKPFFIQIHALTSYPGTLLNRDDAGFAKRLPFGGVTRTRVSSQCLKRHWRTFTGEHSFTDLDAPRSIRSRKTFDIKVAQPLKAEMPDVHELVINYVVSAVKDAALGTKSKGELETSQLTVMGEAELSYLKEVSKGILGGVEDLGEVADELSKDQLKKLDAVLKELLKDKELKKNLQGLGMAAGLDAAMFGRMVTSDVLARGDAAIHVAHAITVHAEESESDYFSAVDDLIAEEGSGELGSAHINSTELTSGLFYHYVVVDVPLLISNLEGSAQEDWTQEDKTLAAQLVERLVHLIATVSPGAKLGSTAPYARANFMMVETGSTQPRTLANAFLNPVSKAGNLTANTYNQLADYLNEYKEMYGDDLNQKCAGIQLTDKLGQQLDGQKVSLKDLAQWASNSIIEQGASS